MQSIETIIASLIAALPAETSERDRHLFRESLRHLVRIAQSEQTNAIRQNTGTGRVPADNIYH